MRILLINPGQLPDAGDDQFAGRMDSLFFRARPFGQGYFGIPLALPTLAAVTPAEHELRIVDEMVEPIDFDQPYDLVGLSAMTCKATRAYQIADEFRRRSVRVVMGGIHASMCPDEAARHADCVVVGEAEDIWAGILADVEHGTMKPRYVAEAFPDVTTLPPPRFDLTRHERYFAYFLQTTRGCPRSCRFCTVTKMNGRRLRKKTPRQVVDEVASAIALPNPWRPTIVDRERGDRRRKVAGGAIFFVDDNFAFDHEHALAVCRALTAFQDQHDVHLNWFTQSDLTTGFDDELLSAMKEAGCVNIFMGFESLHADALAEMHKPVNRPGRYRECIDNVERHGIEVTVSVILGADSDTATVGEDLARFAHDNHVFYFFPNIMTPYPGTQLMADLEAEGRILCREPELYNIRNVVFRPKHMAADVLQSVYVRLCRDALDMGRLLSTAARKLKRPKRHYLTLPWRLFIWLAFSFFFVVLGLRGKLTARELGQLLRYAPRLLIGDGSLNALGFVANAVAFGTFSRSEARRLAQLRPHTVSRARSRS